MSNNFIAKIFFFCQLSAMIMVLYVSIRQFGNYNTNITIKSGVTNEILELRRDNKTVKKTIKSKEINLKYKESETENTTNGFNLNHSIEFKLTPNKITKLKYILQWTDRHTVPFVYMGKGRNGFIDRKCRHVNCYVTSNRKHLGDITKFDVIVFLAAEVIHMYTFKLPKKRSPHQKYVFASIESSQNYPVCKNMFDEYFNWTWTYKLDSDSRWGYIVIRDIENNVIGPNKNMNWLKLDEMDPVSKVLKDSFRTKSKAAAWFVSNCHTLANREEFVFNLMSSLQLYNLSIDIYGDCAPLKCSRENETVCDLLIERDYYFYLAFENAFSEDYVTEKLLRALQYNAIPIVYGGANYTRFMPDGIYLDARKLGPIRLAAQMNELIKNLDKYSEYFRWKSHYTYHRRDDHADTNDYCGFCTLLNDEEKVKETKVYDIRKWWNAPDTCDKKNS